MKKIFTILVLCLAESLSNPCFAFDTWKVDEYNGEHVYSSGKTTTLLVGMRGVGFATDLSGRYQEPIFLSIDSEPPEKFELVDVGMGGLVTYIPNSHRLAERIKAANKVTLNRRNCWTAQCTFSLTGGTGEPIVWAFEMPLAETIKRQ